MLVKELRHHFHTIFAVFSDNFPHKTYFSAFFIKNSRLLRSAIQQLAKLSLPEEKA